MNLNRTLILAVSLLLCAATTAASAGTIVRFSTTLGDFSVELYDERAPATVENFLNYVRDGDYSGTYIHRSVADFVIQGGGYRFVPGTGPVEVPTDPPIPNEFSTPSSRGTIAMARLAGQPDSATSQWFFNLEDNEQLDETEGGYTVFGEVLGGGMAVVDAIAALDTYNLGALAQTIPLRDFPERGSYLNVRSHHFIVVNVEEMQRHSAAVSVFEYASGLLLTTVDAGEEAGQFSLNLSLVSDTPEIVFQLNPETMVPVASVPETAATFSYEDNRLRIPEAEINWGHSIDVLRNLVFVLTDEEQLLFTLESWEE